MSAARSWRRAIGLTVSVTVTCGALQAATPKLERTGATAAAAVSHDGRLFKRKPKASTMAGGSALRGAGLSADRGRSSPAAGTEIEVFHNDEVGLEPWSLIAGALSMMIFIARRRRLD